MDAIKQLIEMGFGHAVLTIFTMALAIKFIWDLLKYFAKESGYETPTAKRFAQHEETMAKLDKKIEHLEQANLDIMEIKNCINQLSGVVEDLKKKSDSNEAARLKDRIAQSYRYHHETGVINTMERESLKDLIAAYSQYSNNSFVHSKVEPEMDTWKVVDPDGEN